MQGYVDPTTKKFVKTAGNASINNIPTATDTEPGLMAPEDKKKIDAMLTADDVAPTEAVSDLFSKQ